MLSARLDHRADAARSEQGRRAAGVAARERRVAPPRRAGGPRPGPCGGGARLRAVLSGAARRAATLLPTSFSARPAGNPGPRRTPLIGRGTERSGAWPAQAAGSLMMDLGDRVTTVK